MLKRLLVLLVLMFGITSAALSAEKVDLRTKGGVEQVKGIWRYAPVQLVEVDAKSANGKPTPTYTIDPQASAADFDDRAWEVAEPETLKNPRGGGKVCFCWYRIQVTIPEAAAGKSVFFQSTVDDYGEIWIDGELPRKPGDVGGPIVAGFNVPNRVELKGAKPGKVYSIAIFGINGPISALPGNMIFLGPTFLEFMDSDR